MSKRRKVEPNLYQIGDVYYYRRGDFEEALGRFKDDKKAAEYKVIYEQKRDALGPLAYKFRVKDVWPDYETEREAQALGEVQGREPIRKSTLKELKDIWKGHLRVFFGNRRLAEVDDIMWNQYVRKSDVGDLTNHRKVLKTFLKWCKANGYVRYMPDLPVPKVKRRKRPILKPEQIRKLLENADGNVLLFIALYLFMGIRRSEQIHLKWEALDLDAGVLVVFEETTRTKKPRAVPINAFVLKLLRARREAQTAQRLKTPWVFPKRGRHQEHAHITGISNPWRTAVKNAGLSALQLQPHDLRATYEFFANKRSDFTDTQREKMAGAAIEVQRKHYVTMEADDLRGLEEVVTFDGLHSVLAEKMRTEVESDDRPGKSRERQKRKSAEARDVR